MRRSKYEAQNLRYECLEPRLPLAGVVTATITGRTLVVQGDSADNSISISAGSSQQGLVRGFGTTVNNSTDFRFTQVIDTIVVDLNGGDDNCWFFNVELTGDFSINDLSGNDRAILTAVRAADVHVDLGEGSNVIDLEGVNIVGDIGVRTGSQNDVIALDAINVGGSMSIATGSGDDIVASNYLNVKKKFLLATGEGNDRLLFAGDTKFSRSGKVDIQTEQGDDSVIVHPSQTSSTAEFARGTIDLGQGDDFLSLDESIRFRRKIRIFGEGGDDTSAVAKANRKSRLNGFENTRQVDAQQVIQDILSTMREASLDTSTYNDADSTSLSIVPSRSELVVDSGGPLTPIDPQVRLLAAGNPGIQSASISITGFSSGNEELSFEDQNGIVASKMESGVLELSGTADVAAWQNAIRSVRYRYIGNSPPSGARTVTITIVTERAVSASFSLTVNAVSSRVSIAQISDRSLVFGEEAVIDLTGDFSNLPISWSIEASNIPDGNNLPNISSSGKISWIPSSPGQTSLTVTATDSLGNSGSMTFGANVGEFVPWQGKGTLARIPVSRRNGIYSLAGKPPMTVDTSKNIEVTFETTAGTIRAQLFSDRAPETVNNFVALALDGFYDGIEFHRVVQDFVAQAGDPLGTGSGGPGYTFEDEVNNGLAFSKPRLLAMANAGPDTNGSQFFITYGTPTSLDGRHTIFGELIGDFSSFENIAITADSVPGVGEIPRQNVTKTRIISVSVR